jgi:hypothetical protein
VGAEQGDADEDGARAVTPALTLVAVTPETVVGHAPYSLSGCSHKLPATGTDGDVLSANGHEGELARLKGEIDNLGGEIIALNAAVAAATGEERLLLIKERMGVRADRRSKQAQLRTDEERLRAAQLLERTGAHAPPHRAALSSALTRRGCPTGSLPALRVPANVSPSQMGLFWQKYQYEAGEPAAYACFRPPVGPPRALPAALVHPSFGCFLDAASVPLSSLKHTYAADSDAALALLEHMGRTFTQEVQRQEVLLPILSQLFGTDVAPFCPSPDSSKSRTDGGILLPGVLGVEALLMVLELKNEIGSGGGDPWFQAARAAELFWVAPERAVLRACSACPTMLLEVVGPMLRVSALAMLPDGGVMMEPLTPFLSLLPVAGQPLALDALICALRALRLAVDELRAAYAALPPAGRGPAGGARSRMLVPYPLADAAVFANARHWCEGKLLFSATHVASGRAVCIKFAPRGYGVDVHAAWAAVGLAPALLEHRVLPGGMHMVVMELLRPEDGWRMLAELDGRQRSAVLAAVLAALRAAHAVPLPCGGAGAHGDCRDANVLVRQCATPDGGVHVDVRFVDFDWSGRAGSAAYPPLMTPAVHWPPGVLPGAPLEHAHDVLLLGA